MQDAAAEAAAAAAAAAGNNAATTGGEDDKDEGECHAVVRIDHMNDSSGYIKKLQ